jgi:hypothetical protein
MPGKPSSLILILALFSCQLSDFLLLRWSSGVGTGRCGEDWCSLSWVVCGSRSAFLSELHFLSFEMEMKGGQLLEAGSVTSSTGL